MAYKLNLDFIEILSQFGPSRCTRWRLTSQSRWRRTWTASCSGARPGRRSGPTDDTLYFLIGGGVWGLLNKIVEIIN